MPARSAATACRHVQVMGREDLDRVDLRVGQHFVEVRVGLAAPLRGAPRARGLVHVTHRGDFGAGMFEPADHVEVGDAAAADDPHADAIAPLRHLANSHA